MNKDGFITELVRLYWCHECGDIDGEDFQNLLLRHGLCEERPATEEDCKTDWAQDWDYKIGDPMIVATAELKAVLERAREA